MSRFTEFWRENFTTREAAPTTVAAPATQPRRGFEYGIPAEGLTEYNSTTGNGDDRTSVMTDLYDAFIACPWSSTAVNAVARSVTSGGLRFGWDNDDGEGDQEQPDKPLQVLQCERLLKFTNQREDIIQVLRGAIADLLVFGDAYLELVWAAGIPVAIYSLDCPSTTPLSDAHGNVTGYIQQTEQGQTARFEPHEVIHLSLDAPRSGVFGVSPTYMALVPIKIWLFAAATLKEIFRKGMPVNLWVDQPASLSDGDSRKWVDQHMTRNVGPKNIGRPVVTKGGATVTELQQAQVAVILQVLDQQRDAIVSTYGVPPAEAGIIESGNLGGGTGEAQHRMFMVNTCAPIASIVLEKLNYVLLQAFGITGWSLKFDEVDLRDSKVIEEIADMRVKSGRWTLDRSRAEIGEPPVDGGDQPILLEKTGVLVWRDVEAMSTANVAKQTAGGPLDVTDGFKHGGPIELEKPEPEPVPPALAAGAGQVVDPNAPPLAGAAAVAAATKAPTAPPAVPPADDKAKKESRPARESWRVYNARVRLAMAELPEVADDRTGRAA